MNLSQFAQILIVDDDPIIRTLLEGTLARAGYTVTAVDNGYSALERFRANTPDLILLDVVMPGLDGFATCRRLRALPGGGRVPIVILSGLDDITAIEEALEAGASDFVTKPVALPSLVQRVRYSLHASRTELALEQSRAYLEETKAALLQSEKMASIGQLAAGVAHEINNPVAFVQSNLCALRSYVKDLLQVLAAGESLIAASGNTTLLAKWQAICEVTDLEYLRSDISSLLNESDEGLRRVRQIVGDLKSLSRADQGAWETADLLQGLESTLNVVRNEIKYKADIIRELQPLPPVICLASQINQVFMNLLVNAAQAIENHGTIILRSGTRDNWVWIEIKDDGIGISPEHLSRIFDPFFTTKPVGQGTGLGLSVAYGIVRHHGGRIEVTSELGKGSTFRVWLPEIGGPLALPDDPPPLECPHAHFPLDDSSPRR